MSPVELFHQSPASVSNPTPNVIQVDFGRVAFGNLQLTPPPNATGTIKVHFSEKLMDGRIDSKPPGTVRYNIAIAELNGNKPQIVAPPADARNTEQVSDKHPPAVLTPTQWSVVVPFRWVEIAWENNSTFEITITLPRGISAKVELPASEGTTGVVLDGKPVEAQLRGDHWILSEDVSGAAAIEVR